MSLSAQSPIDHSKGHAFLHNGNLYYSPNSSRHITIPERPTGTGSRYRFHKKDAHWERFHDPQWWTLEYCFLSFVPLRPSFQGETFSTLRDILPFITGRRYFSNTTRYFVVNHWSSFQWKFWPSLWQSDLLDRAWRLDFIYISAPRPNKLHVSCAETYPALVFGISKAVHVLTFGTTTSYHITRLVYHLDGPIIIQNRCGARLVWFFGSQRRASNLAQSFSDIHCL